MTTDLKRLAELCDLFVIKRRKVLWKIATNQPEDDLLMMLGLSKGHQADLVETVDNLFNEVLFPLIDSDYTIAQLFAAMSDADEEGAPRPLRYVELCELSPDQQILLAKRFLDLDENIENLNRKLAGMKSDAVGQDRMQRQVIESACKELGDEQVEILHIFALNELNATAFRHALEAYKGMDVTTLSTFLERISI